MRLLFGGKLEQMPLQTADILAYEAYKRFQEPGKPERKPWQILKPKVVAVHIPAMTQHVPPIPSRPDIDRPPYLA